MIGGERIIGGAARASKAQALAYLLAGPGRRVPDGEVRAIADALWDFGAATGVDPSALAAQIAHETGRLAFTGDVQPGQHNVAGIGTTGGGVPGLSWPDWRAGVAAYVCHLATWAGRDDLAYLVATSPDTLNPRLPLVRAARATQGPAVRWSDLAGRWAVPGTGYAAGLDRHHDGILAMPGEQPMAPNIALSAGHRNTSGGDAFEREQTAQLTPAVARACRALGMEVRVVQPDDGAGMFAGGLDAVAQTVVGWATGGWVPDIYLETHTEGGGGTGVFAIHPDWTGDVDVDVRDRLGPDVARRVAAATGLGLRGGTGVMSERQTGVGAAGSRLGIFRVTAPLRATTTRLIVEYGAHDKQPDLDIAKGAGFADRCGTATAAAFAAFLGWQVPDQGGRVPAPADPIVVTPFVDAQGRAGVTILFGGRVKRILGVNAADIGVSAIGMDDATYDRSLIGNAERPWVKRGA